MRQALQRGLLQETGLVHAAATREAGENQAQDEATEGRKATQGAAREAWTTQL